MFSGSGPVSGLERQVRGREVKNFVSLPFSKLVRSTAHFRRVISKIVIICVIILYL
jgi:hypothetical protein